MKINSDDAIYIEQENGPTCQRDSSLEKSIDESSAHLEKLQKLNP